MKMGDYKLMSDKNNYVKLFREQPPPDSPGGTDYSEPDPPPLSKIEGPGVSPLLPLPENFTESNFTPSLYFSPFLHCGTPARVYEDKPLGGEGDRV